MPAHRRVLSNDVVRSSSVCLSVPWPSSVFVFAGATKLKWPVWRCHSIFATCRQAYKPATSASGASEDITLQLINTKCIPILLYGLEACPLLKSDLSSLDFVVNRLFMKLFKTSNIDFVRCCQGFDLPSVSWSKRVKKFEGKFHAKISWRNKAVYNVSWICRERTAKTVNCCNYSYFV